MSQLADRDCIPCRGGVPALEEGAVGALLEELDGWNASGVRHIEKSYRFRNFADALEWVNQVGVIAEEQNHHPDIYFTWGRAKLEIRTHAIDGLTESDFILAAKIDRLPG